VTCRHNYDSHLFEQTRSKLCTRCCLFRLLFLPARRYVIIVYTGLCQSVVYMSVATRCCAKIGIEVSSKLRPLTRNLIKQNFLLSAMNDDLRTCCQLRSTEDRHRWRLITVVLSLFISNINSQDPLVVPVECNTCHKRPPCNAIGNERVPKIIIYRGLTQ